jgi:phosphatidylserine decarboxylase
MLVPWALLINIRGDELGYFAFGGSTILLIFQAGTITFDADLLVNSNKPSKEIFNLFMVTLIS